jgi:hypothetical protein
MNNDTTRKAPDLDEAALAALIADLVWDSRMQVRFAMGRDEVEQRCRNFLTTFAPAPEWGQGGRP